jgi:hypothetical protein
VALSVQGITGELTDESFGSLYNDSIAGYSVHYPAGANLFFNESPDHIREFWIATPGNITIMKISSGKTEKSLEELATERRNHSASLSSYSLVSDKAMTIDGSPARMFEYTWKADNTALQSFQILIVRDGQFYILRHDDAAENYEKDASLLDLLTSSFRFIQKEDTEKSGYSDSETPPPGVVLDDFQEEMEWDEGSGMLQYLIPQGIDYFGRYWYFNTATGEWVWDYGGYLSQITQLYQEPESVVTPQVTQTGSVVEGPGGLVLTDIGGGCEGSSGENAVYPDYPEADGSPVPSPTSASVYPEPTCTP